MNDTNRMVSVPCELLEQALDAAAAVGMQDVADELNRILTPSTEKQHQDEPSLWRFRASLARPWNTTENLQTAQHARAQGFEVHDFYQAAPTPKVTPAALMLAMENLAVKASAANHPPVFPPTSVRQVPLVMLGGVCLRVSYSGLKWYHDQLIDDRWEQLSADEFEALLTDALRDSQGGRR